MSCGLLSASAAFLKKPPEMGFLVRKCFRARGILSISWAFHPGRIWVGTSGCAPWSKVIFLEESRMCFLGIHRPGHIPAVLSREFWSQNFGQDTSTAPCAFWRVLCPSLHPSGQAGETQIGQVFNLSFEVFNLSFPHRDVTHTEPSGAGFAGGRESPVSSIKTFLPDFLS